MANGKRTEFHPKRIVDRAGCDARSLASSSNIKLTEVDGETGKKIGLLRKMKENRESKNPKSTQEEPAVREPINFSVAMGKKPDDGGY